MPQPCWWVFLLLPYMTGPWVLFVLGGFSNYYWVIYGVCFEVDIYGTKLLDASVLNCYRLVYLISQGFLRVRNMNLEVYFWSTEYCVSHAVPTHSIGRRKWVRHESHFLPCEWTASRSVDAWSCCLKARFTCFIWLGVGLLWPGFLEDAFSVCTPFSPPIRDLCDGSLAKCQFKS